VYGEHQTVPPDACETDLDCNSAASTTENVFECVSSSCRLSLDYVLERSMCSKTCSTNDDCKNSSLSNRPTVDDDETACETGSPNRPRVSASSARHVCSDDLPAPTVPSRTASTSGTPDVATRARSRRRDGTLLATGSDADHRYASQRPRW
jgi:hypothetical protein